MTIRKAIEKNPQVAFLHQLEKTFLQTANAVSNPMALSESAEPDSAGFDRTVFDRAVFDRTDCRRF
jgi:hypothetical protein